MVMLGNFSVDRSAPLGIGNMAVCDSDLEDSDTSKLGNLATKKLAVFDSEGHGLTVHGLRPAEFLNKKPLKIKLPQIVAYMVHVDRHTSNNSLAVSQPQRANDAWFLDFFVLMYDTQPVCLAHLGHHLGQGFITDAAAELAVQGIDSRLA